MFKKVMMLIVLLAAPAFAFNPNTDESLLGWWPLNDGSGLTAMDLSGQGHNGSLTNGPVWTTGYYGGGLQFDGTDDYVDTDWNENLATWTICCWVIRFLSPHAGIANVGLLPSAVDPCSRNRSRFVA